MRYQIKLEGDGSSGVFEFLSSLNELANHLVHHTEVVRELFGTSIRTTGMSSRKIWLSANVSEFRWIPGYDRTEATKFTLASKIIQILMQGVFEYEKVQDHLVPSDDTVDFKIIRVRRIITVSYYTGTMLPVLESTIFISVMFFLDVIARACLEGPPGPAWEVITAHGRKVHRQATNGR